VPGTDEGLPAIRELLTQGLNINITLLFARNRYEEIARTYIEALEARHRANQPIGHVASVASFSVSRIDTAVDAILTEKLRTATETEQPELERLLGEAAIANARLAYGTFNEIFSGPRWSALAAAGARVQRVIWTGTSVKNPVYHDVRYVEELIGNDTVNSMTMNTLDAFRQHGHVRPSLDEGLEDAADTLIELERVGVSMSAVTAGLLEKGVEKFVRPYNALLSTLERRCHDVGRRTGWQWLRDLWSHR
jgi:transaldolase